MIMTRTLFQTVMARLCLACLEMFPRGLRCDSCFEWLDGCCRFAATSIFSGGRLLPAKGGLEVQVSLGSVEGYSNHHSYLGGKRERRAAVAALRPPLSVVAGFTLCRVVTTGRT